MSSSDTPAVAPGAARRRVLLRRLALAPLGGPLLLLPGGCGFELRRAPELTFRTLQLANFRSRSPLADELRSTIDASRTTKVVDALPDAQVVLEALEDVRDKFVVASGAAGQVTEFRLRERFVFRLKAQNGRELIAPTELVQSRDLSYTESAALAKEQEENFLYRAMQGDIVAQVMRRLASVRPA